MPVCEMLTPWQWECELENKADIKFAFPDDDLLTSLVDHYFVNANAYMPLLHRPTFEKSVQEGKHFSDQGFAATVLLACAIGSRYCDDPRVLLDDIPGNQYAAGWKYFVQVPPIEVSPVSRPSCYELQKCVVRPCHVYSRSTEKLTWYFQLMVVFMTGSSSPRGCWTLVGTALRFVQDLGVHRRRMSGPTVTKAQHEHWKRIFWFVCHLADVQKLTLRKGVSFAWIECLLWEWGAPLHCRMKSAHLNNSRRTCR